MTFAFPTMLWALLGLSIPIIIHLFDFQKPKKVVFSDIRFLKQVNQATKNARELKNLLVLLCRLLAVAFLVFAFAQPLWKKSNMSGSTPTQQVVILADNSYSTEASEGGNSLLDLSLQSAEKVVKSFPASATFRIVTNQFANKERYFVNKQKALEAISETNYAPKTRSATEVYDFVNNAPESNLARVYWFSDFQKSTTGSLSKVKTDTARNWKLVPLGLSDISNVFIDSIWVSNPAIRQRENNFVEFIASNSGGKNATDVTFKLFVGNTQTGATTLSIPANGQVKSKIAFNLPENQLYTCRLECNDEPIRFDNIFYFVLKPAPKVMVTLVRQGKQPFFEAAFSNKELFDFRVFESSNIDFERVKQSDLLVVSGISANNSGLQSAIEGLLQTGGSVWITPGTKTGIDFWNNITQNVPGLSGKYLGNDSTSAVQQGIQLPDTRDPFFEGVFEKLPENSYLPFAKVVIEPSYKGRTIMTLKTGQPLLSVYAAGEGLLYTLNTMLDEKMTNMARNALFVPVCYKIAFSSLRKSDRLYYNFAQKTIHWRTELSGKTNVYALKSEEGNWIPRQVFSKSQVQMEVPGGLTKAGFYDVVVNQQTDGTVAINYSKAESNMEIWNAEDLKKYFSDSPHVEIIEDADPQTLAGDVLAETSGYPLWGWCLWLALICLLAEILIIRFLPSWNTFQV